MVKRFRVPLVNRIVTLYAGRKAYGQWVKAIKAHGCDEAVSPNPSSSGRCWGGWAWVSDIEDSETVFHELSHVLSNLYNVLGCEDEEEFRAYISGHLLGQVYTFLRKIK